MPTPKLFGAEIPFVAHLGFDLVVFEDGRSEIHYLPQPEHLNSFGVAHGGAVMSLMDVTLATACRSVDKDMGVVTIQLNTQFMRPASGQLTGRGRLMHRTATMGFAEATIVDAEGRTCAHATGTFKYVRRLATGPKSANAFNQIPTD